MARAAGGLLAGPYHLADYLLNLTVYRAGVAQDLQCLPQEPVTPAVGPLPERPLRVFISCAEASGELHGANLARALVREAGALGAPAPLLRGFGGARLEAAGVETLADPGAHATMGMGDVFAQLPFYEGLLARAAECFRDWRPDVFVPVDSPALHVPMAHASRRYGVPSVHFIAPQYWAWAPWRVARYRKVVTRTLTILPFESPWFERHGVPFAYVGHPLLDVHAELPPPPPAAERRALVLLPGSRRGVIRTNLPWMLRALEPIRRAVPDLEVLVAQADPAHGGLVEELVAAAGGGARVVVGDLHGTLGRARSALAVSGTVLLDLLHHRVPTVAIYRKQSAWIPRARNLLLTTPWFASVNLLAGREVLPEYCFAGHGPLDEVGALLVRCHQDPRWRADCAEGLERAARRLGGPGATQRAARHVLAACRQGTGAAAPHPSAADGA